jgi:hypothetical protein
LAGWVTRTGMKHLIKALLPNAALNAYRKVRRRLKPVQRGLRRVRNRNLSVKEVFTRVYDTHEWGGRKGQYCSGSGSSDHQATLYATMVKAFVAERNIRTIVDLGCGDFVVGRELQVPGVKYIGVDIVEQLIEHNNRNFGSGEISFLCLDIIADDLPEADLCLVRQVLQHLSNAQIDAVLRKIGKYRYALVTEHYPAPSVASIPNKDKPHGGDTRVVDNSAVFLDLPPFNVRVSKLMLEVEARSNLIAPGETIKTYLLEPAVAR